MTETNTTPVESTQTEATPENVPGGNPPVRSVNPDEVLARKMHQLTKREREFQTRQKEWESKQQEYKPYEELKGNAKKNPVAVLEHFGLTLEEITDFILQEQDPEKIRYKELQEQINALKTDKEKEAQQAIQAKQELAVSEYRQGIAESFNPEQHEFCCTYKEEAVDMVYELSKAFYEERGEMLPLDKAIEWVEEHFETKLMPLTNLKKVQSKFQPKPSEPNGGDFRSQLQAEMANRSSRIPGETINSDMRTSSVQSSQDDSKEARLARAAAFLAPKPKL